MRSLNDWLSEYGESHRHPFNVVIHKFCVPLIMFSLLGLIWCIPKAELFQPYEFLNYSTLFVGFCLVFYLILSFKMFLGMLLMTALMIVGVYQLDQVGVLLETSFAVFLASWALQFWGHKVEGKKPSFLKDLSFLLIGPLWVLRSFYNSLGIKS